jgi:hypothetical protein
LSISKVENFSATAINSDCASGLPAGLVGVMLAAGTTADCAAQPADSSSASRKNRQTFSGMGYSFALVP